MKKLVFLGLLLLCTGFAFAQQAMVLDDAIQDAVNFFSTRLRPGSTVAVTNIEAETKELSDFIIEELIVSLANTDTVRVVERNRLERLQSELNFNMSGSVSDETAQGIGRMIGAQFLISGSISQYRDMYRMRIQAIAVETAEIIGTRTLNVRYDPALTGLLRRMNPADAWKYQWFYAGFNVGYSAQLVDRKKGSGNNIHYEYYLADIPLGFSIYAMIQPFDLFGIALDFSGDLKEGPNISILPTLTIRPSSFEVNLFLGGGLNIISGDFVIMGGIRGGLKAGPGVLYAEVRPWGLLFDDGWGGTGAAFHVNISLGYQIGFIPRKRN